ncbi:MAG: type II secretion system protein GspG [Planctomycetota bacterium]|nr:type II secretion system protein GspG [Planctomycetota bacterium]
MNPRRVGLVVAFLLAGPALLLWIQESATTCVTVARPEDALVELDELATCLRLYAAEHAGQFPIDLEALLEPSASGAPYWTASGALPLDPWSNPYVYERTGSSFLLVSYGKDGQPGGSDDDSDLFAPPPPSLR